MTSERLWRKSSRSLRLLLLVVAVPPAATLVWLGLQLLQQDRSLLAQRDFERHQRATQTAVSSLELSLAATERRGFEGPVPEGMVRLVVSAQGVEAQPSDRVLWLPVARITEVAEERRFADAERLEFQGGADRALVIYEDAARSPKSEVRAGALVRLARVRRLARRKTFLCSSEFRVSPDGAQLAFLQKGSILVMPVAGGEPRTIYRSPGITAGQSTVTWMPAAARAAPAAVGAAARRTARNRRGPRRGGAGAATVGGRARSRRPVALRPLPSRSAFRRRRALFRIPIRLGSRIAFTDVISQASSELWALDNLMPVLKAAR